MRKTKAKKKVTGTGQKKPTRRKRTSQRVLSAAAQIKQRTKQLIDDVFLTIVGTKALVRAQEMTRGLKTGEAKTKGSK